MSSLFEKIGLGRAAVSTFSSSPPALLPRYAPLDSEPAGLSSCQGLVIDDCESQDSIQLADSDHLGTHATGRRRRRGRHLRHQRTRAAAAEARRPTKSKTTRMIPSSRRFWADFTLGFSDGLTVPFALTAGLSSLGHTDTVLYAGLAEISAGCISMGIGGYLSARQTSALPAPSVDGLSEPSPATDDDDADGADSIDGDDNADDDDDDDDDDEAASCIPSSEKGAQHRQDAASAATTTTIADRFLEPLSLPLELRQLVLDHIASQPRVSDALAAALLSRSHSRSRSRSGRLPGSREQDRHCGNDDDNDERVWPVSVGLSVAAGYLIGGMLPLWPYFFVTSVGDGLRWSFAICVLALFLFGFARDFCLCAGDEAARQLSWPKPLIPWQRIGKSAGEGLQMVILGGIAAIAAVLCVRMFEGANDR